MPRSHRHIAQSANYIFIFLPKHPFAQGDYVKRGRLVMEEYLRENEPNHPALIEIDGKKYLRGEPWLVHHKNGIKTDDRLENLDVLQDSEHTRIHNMDGKCSTETRIKLSLATQNQLRDKLTGKFI